MRGTYKSELNAIFRLVFYLLVHVTLPFTCSQISTRHHSSGARNAVYFSVLLTSAHFSQELTF